MSDSENSKDDVEHYVRQVEGEITFIKQALEEGDADSLRSHFGELEGWIKALGEAVEDHAEEIEE